MISIGCNISVPDFPPKEIGDWTLVRAYRNKFQFDVTNDGQESLLKLSVRPVLESYIGQEKPQLYQWGDPQVIESIPSSNLVPIKFEFYPHFPGVVSVALYVTDAANKAVMAKRKNDSSYSEAPVRWWFHVIDDISLETLMELRKLVAK